MKNKTISLRVTDSEYTYIKNQAKTFGLSTSDYIMHKVNNRDDKITPCVMASLENIRTTLEQLSEEVPKDLRKTFSQEVNNLWHILNW